MPYDVLNNILNGKRKRLLIILINKNVFQIVIFSTNYYLTPKALIEMSQKY